MQITVTILSKSEIFHSKRNSLLLNKAYSLYKETWSQIFSTSDFTSDSFLRQDYYILIFDGLIPIGCCAMSHYNALTEVCLDHSYFKSLCHRSLSFLDYLKIDEVYTIELLTVAKNYRGYRSDFNVYQAILQILMNLIRDLDAESVIAPTINTNNAANAASRHGVKLLENINYKNLNCDLIYMTKFYTPDISDSRLCDLINEQYSKYQPRILKLKKEMENVKIKNVS